MNDNRPSSYQYYNQLINWVGDKNKFFNGEFVWPKQFEIHLPSNHKRHCNLNCSHCQGKNYQRDLGHWEMDCLDLLNKLKGEIPFQIYGGAYSEPLMNPYLMTFLSTTKKYNNHFGIHTNGILLKELEDNYGFLTELHRISTDKVDYLSISLDGGLPWNWAKTKGTKKEEFFYQTVSGIKKACSIRDKSEKESHAIRIAYLLSPEVDSENEILSVVSIAKDLKVDSLRFSIPYAPYNQNFDKVRQYEKQKHIFEQGEKYKKIISNFLSFKCTDMPYIFYVSPYTTSVQQCTCQHCIYGYFQITYGADGGVYKCSSVAAPDASQCRLGDATSNIDKFKEMIMKNYNKDFSPEKNCFSKGLRCNRMALEINHEYDKKN
ncbi:MAG: radical SAM protein [bacterium]